MSQTVDETVRFLRSLRTIREYTSEPLSDAEINDILEVGRWSASGGNRQPWDVVVVRDRATLEKFGNWGAKPAATAAAAFLITTPDENPSADVGRLCERMLLAAHAHGLGSCLATLKNEGPEETKKLLNIPAERGVRFLVAVGHIDTAARKALPKNPNAGRKPLTEFAHWDRY